MSDDSEKKELLVCAVCGDKARCRHYGAISCKGCKVFFRRIARNGKSVALTCYEGNACEISYENRRNCRKCRYQKCLSVGMRREWVVTSAAELQKYREKQVAKKPELRVFNVILSDDEMASINRIVDQFKQVTRTVQLVTNEDYSPYFTDRDTLIRVERATLHLLSRQRMVHFANTIPEFAALDPSDRYVLLNNAMDLMSVLRNFFCFECSGGIRWPRKEVAEYSLTKYTPKTMFSADAHMDMSAPAQQFRQFCLKIQKMLRADDPIILMLAIIILFQPEKLGLRDTGSVEKVQDRMLWLLKKYVLYKNGSQQATKLYPELLTTLVDVQQINYNRRHKAMFLNESELGIVSSRLGLDPSHITTSFEIYENNYSSIDCEMDCLSATPSIDAYRRLLDGFRDLEMKNTEGQIQRQSSVDIQREVSTLLEPFQLEEIPTDVSDDKKGSIADDKVSTEDLYDLLDDLEEVVSPGSRTNITSFEYFSDDWIEAIDANQYNDLDEVDLDDYFPESPSLFDVLDNVEDYLK